MYEHFVGIELQSGGILDLIDSTGARLHLNEKPRERAVTLIKPKAEYQVVKIGMLGYKCVFWTNLLNLYNM